MDQSKDYYKILGVDIDASQEEIQAMHRMLAKKYHADANSLEPELKKWSHDMMTELNEAYSVLKHPKKRQDYDQVRASRSNLEDGLGEDGVQINSWDDAIHILLDGASQIHTGAPTQDLEESTKKQVEKNIKRRVKKYLRLGVPNYYQSAYMHNAMDNIIADAIETIQEKMIRNYVLNIYGFIVVVFTIIYEIRKPGDGIGEILKSAGGHILGWIAIMYFYTWLLRLVTHGLKYNLLGFRGIFLNGVVAIALLIYIGSEDVFSSKDRDGWVMSETPDGSFGAKFPIEAKFDKVDAGNESYNENAVALIAETSKAAFVVSRVINEDFEDNFYRLVRNFRRSSNTENWGEILRDEEVNDNSHIFAIDAAGERSVIIKLILHRDELFQLRVLTTDEMREEVFVHKFLESFWHDN